MTLKVKKDCSFIQFDIKEFYTSITEEILKETISFAKSLIDLDDHKIGTIKTQQKIYFVPQKRSMKENNYRKLF